MEAPEDKAEYLTTLFQKVYLSDIVERHKVRSKAELDELVDVLASSTGSCTSLSKLMKTFKSVKNKTLSDKTIKNYMDYLMDSFLISKAARYGIKGKKYIGSPAKYYFEDVGLRNARLGFRQVEENHLMENIIYNELWIRGYHVDVGVVEHNSANSAGKREKSSWKLTLSPPGEAKNATFNLHLPCQPPARLNRNSVACSVSLILFGKSLWWAGIRKFVVMKTGSPP